MNCQLNGERNKTLMFNNRRPSNQFEILRLRLRIRLLRHFSVIMVEVEFDDEV